MPKHYRNNYSGMARIKSLPLYLLFLGFLGFVLPWGIQELPMILNPPSPQVVELATATAMTPEAQKLFYQQDPAIQDKAIFKESCSKLNHGNDELVALGCFRSMSRGTVVVSGKIYIQSIVDSRFQGIMETTAAHEMLHAVYVRLNPSDQADLAPRLAKAATLVKDSRLASVLKQYKERDLQLYYNELHSHLGTELADLNDEVLEKHYRRYFTDRQKVVALAARSQTAFRELDNKAKALKTKIDQLENELKTAKTALEDSERSLESGQQRLDDLKSSLMALKSQAEASMGGEFNQLAQRFESSKAEFNAQVNAYNSQVEQHQGEIASFNQQVEEYKKVVTEYNSIAKEERSLLSELGTSPKSPKSPTKTPSSSNESGI